MNRNLLSKWLLKFKQLATLNVSFNNARTIIIVLTFVNIGAFYVLSTKADVTYQTRFAVFCPVKPEPCLGSAAAVAGYQNQIAEWYGEQTGYTFTKYPTVDVIYGNHTTGYYTNNGNYTKDAIHTIYNELFSRKSENFVNSRTRLAIVTGFSVLPADICGIAYRGPAQVISVFDPQNISRGCPGTTAIAHEIGHNVGMKDLPEGYIGVMAGGCSDGILENCVVGPELKSLVLGDPFFNIKYESPIVRPPLVQTNNPVPDGSGTKGGRNVALGTSANLACVTSSTNVCSKAVTESTQHFTVAKGGVLEVPERVKLKAETTHQFCVSGRGEGTVILANNVKPVHINSKTSFATVCTEAFVPVFGVNYPVQAYVTYGSLSISRVAFFEEPNYFQSTHYANSLLDSTTTYTFAGTVNRTKCTATNSGGRDVYSMSKAIFYDGRKFSCPAATYGRMTTKGDFTYNTGKTYKVCIELLAQEGTKEIKLANWGVKGSTLTIAANKRRVDGMYVGCSDDIKATHDTSNRPSLQISTESPGTFEVFSINYMVKIR